jgi:Cu-Zn family superoxide dismutase
MQKIFSNSRLALGAWVVFSLSGCPSPQGNTKPEGGGATATATIEARSNSTVSGTATFEQINPKKVKVVIEISGAPPGQHGLHLHEKGDCSDPEAKSAGDHFNPAKVAHGNPESMPHHAGDYGNITVGEDGKGKVAFVTDEISVSTGENGVIGRAVVLHAKADDLTSQPSGNAGARIGCGVITAK